MKILFINSIGKNKWGGGEKWLILASQGLKKRGHTVTIGCYPDSFLERKSIESGIPVLPLNIKSDLSYKSTLQLSRFFESNDTDIVVCVQNRDLMFAGLAASMGKAPVLISRHGVKLIKNGIKHKYIYNKYCKGLITNTKTIKEEYDSYGWWEDDFVKVIYNGVEEYSEKCDKYDLHSVVPQLNERSKIVISIGRLSKQKGYKYLIDAASEVVKKYPDVYFFIAGRGKERNKLLKQISKKGLQEKFFILPFLNNVKPLIESADLFVLPSLYEGMPNVVLEALAQKHPVICTKVNGTKEIFGEKNSSALLPPADKNSLRDAILNFLQTGETGYNKEEVYERVKKIFTLEAMYDELEAYLKEKTTENKKAP